MESGLRQAARVPGRAQELLSAVLEASKGLRLETTDVLRRIIDAGRGLVRARCAALGVLNPAAAGRFAQVVTSGFGADIPASPDGTDSPLPRS
ncbi:hypothetical protein [Streptomyces sp. NPDC019539]|uniref:hypothetical protein n=1 Tax=Streptomyces sp. NPDC019539 TaxID=3365063 RepID=UPI0037B659DA